MGILLEIVKPEKEIYFDLNKGFNYIKGIAEYDKPQKLNMTLIEFVKSLKNAIEPLYFSYDIKKRIDEFAPILYEWIGDDLIYQTFDNSIPDEALDYKCVGDRFDLFDYKDTEDNQ